MSPPPSSHRKRPRPSDRTKTKSHDDLIDAIATGKRARVESVLRDRRRRLDPAANNNEALRVAAWTRPDLAHVLVDDERVMRSYTLLDVLVANQARLSWAQVVGVDGAFDRLHKTLGDCGSCIVRARAWPPPATPGDEDDIIVGQYLFVGGLDTLADVAAFYFFIKSHHRKMRRGRKGACGIKVHLSRAEMRAVRTMMWLVRAVGGRGAFGEVLAYLLPNAHVAARMRKLVCAF